MQVHGTEGIEQQKLFLFVDLLGGISDLSEEVVLELVVTSPNSIQRMIETNFEEMVSFLIVGKRLIIYSSNGNLCIYVASTLKGCEPCDDD